MKLKHILFIAGVIVFTGHGAHSLQRPGALDERVATVPAHEISIMVDPRIELIMAAQLISGYQPLAPLLTGFNFTYRLLMIDYLRYHTEHPVINTLIRLSQGGFTRSVPLEVMLHLTTPPDLEQLVPLERDLMRKVGGGRDFKRFQFDIKTFAIDSDFMEFYRFSGSFYKTIMNEVFYTLEDTDLTDPLDRYMGASQNSYNFVLATLSFDGAYGIYVGQPDSLDAYCVFGPRAVGDDGNPVFGDLELFRKEAWHMFGHSFVNSMTARNMDALNHDSELFEPIREQMRKAGVPTWQDCVNEHIVRGVMTRLYSTEVGPEAGEKILAENRDQGFIYLHAVVQRLGEYEANRDRYPTFAEFFPRLVNLFGELRQSTVPVRMKR